MLAHVAERAVRRRLQVDGGLSPACGDSPRRGEELLGGRDEVLGATTCALGVHEQHRGVARHEVDEQLHVLDEGGRQRLHALDRDALGHLAGELEQLGVPLAELLGGLPHLVGEQQLAARGRPDAGPGLERALVGDRERPDLLDVVAPELHAQRVLLGRREDVDEAAAHGELAALLDEVDPGVRRGRQRTHRLVEVGGLTHGQLDGLEVGETLDLRLEHGAHRRDDDLQRPGALGLAGVGEAAQHGEPASDRVAARTQALVGQRLPAREVRDRIGVDEVAQHGEEILGLARRGRHGEHRATGLDEARDDEGAQRLGRGQVEGVGLPVAQLVERDAQGAVGEDQVGQGGQAQQDSFMNCCRVTHESPRPRSAGGVPSILGRRARDPRVTAARPPRARAPRARDPGR